MEEKASKSLREWLEEASKKIIISPHIKDDDELPPAAKAKMEAGAETLRRAGLPKEIQNYDSVEKRS
jgi:L-lysine 2,3-aminomutase